jgi:hypothetical protein
MIWFLQQLCCRLPWWLRISRLKIAPHYCLSWDCGWVHPRHQEAECCRCFRRFKSFGPWKRCWREHLQRRLQGKPEPEPKPLG